jgi:hypothetical protein
MKKKISLFIGTGLFLVGCTEREDILPLKNKTACECADGTIVVWNENLMRQTGWTTGNPCWDKGGIKKYIYGN